ncbi:MAG TPA: undecaprenyl-diphosphatase UppP [Candidatus Paceibacterota bacterium]|nr:undecaprenyl-diphosphatase UppP [Candidatus Paceibacterota bacterium]
MSIIEAILLGVVEGVTEFLPISSTAHLVIASRLLQVPESAFLGSFIIAIQLGAIGAVVLLYWRTILLNPEGIKRIAVAFVPTAVAGFVLYQLLKNVLLENLALIAWALVLGGIVLIVFERWYAARPKQAAVPLESLPFRTAFLIGCAQALAIIPGVSRAGATIIGGLALGVGRKEIVEFSFLLAIPTMLAATGYDLLKSGSAFATNDWGLLGLGFIVSFVAAYASVRWLLRFIQTHTFTGFGWYRIVIGGAILAVLYIA